MQRIMAITVVLMLLGMGASALAQEQGDNSVYLLDMRQCMPSNIITSKQIEPGKWFAVSYEIAEGAGYMVFNIKGADPPPLTLDPKVTGWHKVYLGAYYHGFTGWTVDRAIGVRLSGEEDYTRVDRPDVSTSIEQMAESFWRVVDLTGRKLEFTRPTEAAQACLAYVRLVPMTVEEVAAWQAGDRLPDTVGFARPVPLLKLDGYPTGREWFRTTCG